MIKVPYEVIEFREDRALVQDYSWNKVLTHFFYSKTLATVIGMAAGFYLYGYLPSWDRSIFFWKYEIGEAIGWIPLMISCAILEYGKVILRVHKRMGVVLKGRDYYKV